MFARFGFVHVYFNLPWICLHLTFCVRVRACVRICVFVFVCVRVFQMCMCVCICVCVCVFSYGFLCVCVLFRCLCGGMQTNTAFTVRLFAVIRYESVIHEFDPSVYQLPPCFPLLPCPAARIGSERGGPCFFFFMFWGDDGGVCVGLSCPIHRYFNYRVTQYIVKEGSYKFYNWFDDRTWYPLGRIIGATVYPGEGIPSQSILLFVHVCMMFLPPLCVNCTGQSVPLHVTYCSCYGVWFVTGLMVTAAAMHRFLELISFPISVRNVCVFLAPVFASMTTLVAYFFGKQIRDEKAGLFAAAFIALVPGVSCFTEFRPCMCCLLLRAEGLCGTDSPLFQPPKFLAPQGTSLAQWPARMITRLSPFLP